MRIKDTGNGWKVTADWYGQERVVFTPTAVEPFSQLRQCVDYIKGMS